MSNQEIEAIDGLFLSNAKALNFYKSQGLEGTDLISTLGNKDQYKVVDVLTVLGY